MYVDSGRVGAVFVAPVIYLIFNKQVLVIREHLKEADSITTSA